METCIVHEPAFHLLCILVLERQVITLCLLRWLKVVLVFLFERLQALSSDLLPLYVQTCKPY